MTCPAHRLLPLLLCVLTIPAMAQDPAPRQVQLGESRTEGDALVIPLLINDLSGVLAGDIDLLFDGRVVSAITARSTELLTGFLFISNPVGDTLKIAFAGALEVESGSGAFCEILVQPADAVPSLTFLMVSLNDGAILVDADPQTAVTEGGNPWWGGSWAELKRGTLVGAASRR